MNRQRSNSERGGAILVAVLLALMTGILTGGIVLMTTSSAVQTTVTNQYESAYLVAEAGLKDTLFQMEAEMGTPDSQVALEPFLSANNGRQYEGEFANGSFKVTLKDPTGGDSRFQLTSVGKVGNAQRTLTATVATMEENRAMDYALFGNYIHFDNHMKVDWGIQLNTSIYSNSSILIDSGVIIQGVARAVQFISPNSGPAGGGSGTSDTILSPYGEQGDPDPDTDVATAPIVQVNPAPEVLPYPSFDFAQLELDAIASDRYLEANAFEDLINSAIARAKSLPGSNTEVELPASDYPDGVEHTAIPIKVIHYNRPVAADRRAVRVPNLNDPDLRIQVGSSDGVSDGLQETYEVIFEGDPLPYNDSILYIQGNLALRLPDEVLLRIEGSLIVNGSLGINAATELLAWENRQAPWFVPLGDTLYDFAQNATEVDNPNKDIKYSRYPAIAANGKLKIDNSGSSQGGPTHIEGVVYTISESHLHRSDPREPAYSVGSEIADVIHNCQFFSFAYDPAAKGTLGFYERLSARPILKIVSMAN